MTILTRVYTHVNIVVLFSRNYDCFKILIEIILLI